MTQPFWNNSANGAKSLLVAGALILVLLFSLPVTVCSRSASSPRHSGLEPPGGPRQLESLPGGSPSRTSEGGMGYTDAYGNTMQNKDPEEKQPKQRLRSGAYGGYDKKNLPPRPLPDINEGPPLWKF